MTNITKVEAVPVPSTEQTQLSAHSDVILRWATALTIATDADLAAADAAQGKHDAFQSRVESFFRPKIKRWHEGHKAECESFNGVNDPLKKAKKLNKAKMGAYTLEQENKRQEEQRQLEAAALKAAEDQRLADAEACERQGMREEASMILDQPIEAPVVAPPPPLPKTKTRLTTTWQFEYTDPDLVERSLCMPHDPLVRDRLRKTNGLPIKGVRAWKQKG